MGLPTQFRWKDGGKDIPARVNSMFEVHGDLIYPGSGQKHRIHGLQGEGMGSESAEYFEFSYPAVSVNVN